MPANVISRSSIVLVLLTLAAPGLLHAESPIGFRQLVTVSPVAIQRGTERTLTIHSNLTLDGAYSVLFDKPGIAMTYAETEKLEAALQGRGTPGNPYRFKTVVPAAQPLGIHEVRVATDRAVSSASHLFVTDYPVLEEQPNNDTRETAQPVQMPVTVCGVCEASEDVDFFKFTGKAGKRVWFEMYAQRVTEAIHSMQGGAAVYLMDALMTLYGPHGQVLAQNDNFYGGDPFLEVTLPEDGDYFLEVRDARYIGNPKYVYCVEISDRPYVHAVFPLAVQSGTTANVEVVGQMPSGFEQTPLTTSPGEPEGWKLTSLDTPQGRTNQFPVLISPHPQMVAPAGITSREKAAALTLPVGVSGRFTELDEVHHFAFNATAGRYYLIEVDSQQRGYALDSVLAIYDATGKKLQEADDGLQTKDSKLYFKAPADGTYTIAVSDLHGRSGPRFLYHLRVEPSGPDFAVHGEYYYAMLSPGSRVIWFARVERLNGFDGPVEMQIEGLPQGVSLTPVTIPANMNHCGLILSAAADAPINASLVRVSGKAVIPDLEGKPQTVIRNGRVTCELQTQGGGQARWPIATQLVGVVQPMDLLKVEAEPAEITLKPGEKAEIKVRIERKPEYKDAVTLAMVFDYFQSVMGDQLPPGVKMSPGSKFRLSGTATEGTVILEADAKAVPVERLPIAVLARVSISFSITTNYASNPLSLTVLPAEPAK